MRKLLKAGLLAGVLLGIAASSARAVDRDAVNRAIDKGVAALRRLQRGDGAWPHPDSVDPFLSGMPLQVGATALAGLTLLECRVPADDPAVARAAEVVRRASVQITDTYSIALSILFFDRLGDPDDIPFVESLTLRLLAGQTSTGGWNYNCPPIADAEVRRLMAKLGQRKQLKGSREMPKPGSVKRSTKDLSREIQQQLGVLNRVGTLDVQSGSDNSNTQFATLALWVGRRYGLPVEKALRRVEMRFRTTQNADGGWGYFEKGMMIGPMGGSTASMTCAGLLGLAVATGTANEAAREKKASEKPARDINKDPEVKKGLLALAGVIGSPQGGKRLPPAQVGGRSYYFFWSLERVAVALDLKTIGKKDWYDWGAEILLANQRADGSWQGNYGPCGADTCFALLFLRRANLAPDLTAQFKGQIMDPGPRVLKSGALGGGPTGEKIPELKPGLEGKDAKPDSERMEHKPLRDKKDNKPVVRNPPPARPAKPAPDASPARVTKPAADAPRTNEAKRPDSTSMRMADDLVKASGTRETQLLAMMYEGKGPQFTEALVYAIGKLTGERRERARDALADRLARMKDETLARYCQDEETEIRRAAALACAIKRSKALVPSLIPLLDDPSKWVAETAHGSLKQLTRQDFGPPADANGDQRKEAMRKWLDWWAKQKPK